MKNKIKLKPKLKQKRKNICKSCEGSCCKHVALELDTPTAKRDYDNIRWFLMHKNVIVFIDHNNTWNLEFDTPCEYLNKSFQCSVYSIRPKVCREYPAKDEICVYEGKEKPYKERFQNEKELERYLKKKKIDWKWKKLS